MLERFNGNVEPFANNALGSERTVFGDVEQSDSINDNLNSDFLRGWGIVGINDNPTKQDFNALGFTLGNLISYLYQQGIPVWNTNQEYFTGSRVVGSDGSLYKSLSGVLGTPNVGNDPATDSENWEKAIDSTNEQQIGVRQSWQDVTANRSLGVTYTNTTGKAIVVSIGTVTTGVAGYVDGSQIMRQLSTDSTVAMSGIMIVPPNSTYIVSGYVTGGFDFWKELR
jgi:hypothetical protein